jgi:hypothetical protein
VELRKDVDHVDCADVELFKLLAARVQDTVCVHAGLANDLPDDTVARKPLSETEVLPLVDYLTEFVLIRPF